MKKQLRKLYFVVGKPTKAQAALCEEIGAVFRNAAYVTETDFAEPCESVLGQVPKLYEKCEKHERAADAEALIDVEPEPELDEETETDGEPEPEPEPKASAKPKPAQIKKPTK